MLAHKFKEQSRQVALKILNHEYDKVLTQLKYKAENGYVDLYIDIDIRVRQLIINRLRQEGFEIRPSACGETHISWN